MSHAFRSGDQAKKPNPIGACSLERSNRRGCAASGCKHRIEKKKISLRRVSGHLEVVVDGLESAVIAVQSNVSDAGRRHESKNPLHHAETCAENRNEGQLLTTNVPSGGDLERGVYIARLEAQLTRRLVGHQHRDFVNQLLKMLRLGFLVAENRQLVLNKRMPDNSQRGEFLDALDHSRPLTPALAPWTLTGS